MTSVEDLMTPAQAADRAGIGVARLATLAREMRLKTRRTPGGHRMYSEADLDAIDAWRRRREQIAEGQ